MRDALIGGSLLVGVVFSGFWIWFYFKRLEPYLQKKLGERFGVTVIKRRGLRSSYWDADQTSTGKSIFILLCDLLASIFILFGPIFVVLAGVILIAIATAKPNP